jgi:hypothetical protein
METSITVRQDLSVREVVLEFRISQEDIMLIEPYSAEYKLFKQLDAREIPLSLRLANAALLIKYIEREKERHA